MSNLHFQYCQKIVVLSKDFKKVLLCKRKGEADLDGIFTFIGGKMETTDETIINGLTREKNEEVSPDFKIKIFPTFTYNMTFKKKDGNLMILPHFLAIHHSGDIKLNEEYSEYRWVEIDNLSNFHPMISSIPETIKNLLKLKKIITDNDYLII